jgi:hypothetical protein
MWMLREVQGERDALRTERDEARAAPYQRACDERDSACTERDEARQQLRNVTGERDAMAAELIERAQSMYSGELRRATARASEAEAGQDQLRAQLAETQGHLESLAAVLEQSASEIERGCATAVRGIADSLRARTEGDRLPKRLPQDRAATFTYLATITHLGAALRKIADDDWLGGADAAEMNAARPAEHEITALADERDDLRDQLANERVTRLHRVGERDEARSDLNRLRDLLAEILAEFDASKGDGYRARVGQVKYAGWRRRAGTGGA